MFWGHHDWESGTKKCHYLTFINLLPPVSFIKLIQLHASKKPINTIFLFFYVNCKWPHIHTTKSNCLIVCDYKIDDLMCAHTLQKHLSIIRFDPLSSAPNLCCLSVSVCVRVLYILITIFIHHVELFWLIHVWLLRMGQMGIYAYCLYKSFDSFNLFSPFMGRHRTICKINSLRLVSFSAHLMYNNNIKTLYLFIFSAHFFFVIGVAVSCYRTDFAHLC